jgi:D-alanyl-D-alanine carboxypeptidase-like protein
MERGCRALRGVAAILLAALLPWSCASAPAAEPASDAPSASGDTPAPTDTVVPSPTDVALAKDGQPRFAGRISRLPSSLRREMRGTTWKPGCPVPLTDLRLLHVDYWGFDGEVQRGPIVVHKDVATEIRWVFGRLFRARFPIKHVALAKEFVPEEFEPRISSSRSVTASFNCRPVVTPLGPGDDFSQHAYGLAIDINPVQNPFVTATGFVRNRMSRRYLDRRKRLPGVIHEGDVVVRSFAAIGWEWGGNWSGGKDYMHFSRSGG